MNKNDNLKGLKAKYEKEIAKKLRSEFDIKNIEATPKITKVVVNVGLGELTKSKEGIKKLSKDLSLITGQLPSVRPAKISVAGFGIREGMPVGLKVTLRGKRMYSFVEKLFSIVLPRLRDFRGTSLKSFDNFGNYTIGITEHTVFPELVSESQSAPKGMEVTIVTSTQSKDEAKKLLELMGMPFAKEEE